MGWSYRQRNEDRRCQALMRRSRRHPVADLKCGNAAMHEFAGMMVCGIHLRQLERERAKKVGGSK